MLASIVTLLGVGLVATLVARAIRAPAIIGFLVAGMVVGPSGLSLIDHHEVESLAELGLVLLLFTIGLELSPAPLFQMGLRLMIATAVQMGVTATLVAIVCVHVFGVPVAAAIVMGLAASPASTAIVL